MINNYIILSPVNEISKEGNLLIFALAIKSLYKKGMQFEVRIPKSIKDYLTQDEFNTFFTDILLDARVTDTCMKIFITLEDTFKVRVC